MRDFFDNESNILALVWIAIFLPPSTWPTTTASTPPS